MDECRHLHACACVRVWVCVLCMCAYVYVCMFDGTMVEGPGAMMVRAGTGVWD